MDRQLSGPYGSGRGLFVSPPFLKGQKNQGPQDPDGPAAIYRKALAGLDVYVRQRKGDIFAKLAGASAFPQNAGYNRTGTLSALAFWATEAIRTQYLKNPGPMVYA